MRRRGWTAELGRRGLGDTLLALGLVQALRHATDGDEVHYSGPLERLMERCDMPIRTGSPGNVHLFAARPGARGHAFLAVPEREPTWLDQLDDARVEVHSALPMRYYLAIEQSLGVRLPAAYAPAPTFTSAAEKDRFHVVFVTATSWPDRKDYRVERYAQVAEAMQSRLAQRWRFTMIPGAETPGTSTRLGQIEVQENLDAADCVDVFASADVVIGNDTGLTHLAALTAGPDGTGPHVVALCSRHAHAKWTTGRDRHHAVATGFSHLLSIADRCPVRDQIDDTTWGPAASLAQLAPDLVADFAGELAGWW